MANQTRYLDNIFDIIEKSKDIFKTTVTIKNIETIPDTNNIPLIDPSVWLKIPDIICVFCDMKNSTELNAVHQSAVTARVYSLFTGTAIDIFHSFRSSYIDIKGDGVFALFNKDQVHRALCAAISFKTFVNKCFMPQVKKLRVQVGSHIGIDQKTVLVKRLGLKRLNMRTDRQNEVWAGKPINMAAKLASLSDTGEVLVSDRYFNNIKDPLALNSCGCGTSGSSFLWNSIDVSTYSKFDFNTAYRLRSDWCESHGAEYCTAIMRNNPD